MQTAYDAYEMGLGIGVVGRVGVQIEPSPSSAAPSMAMQRRAGAASRGRGWGPPERDDMPACVPVREPAQVAAQSRELAQSPAVTRAIASRAEGARHPHMAPVAFNRAGRIAVASPARMNVPPVAPIARTVAAPCVGCAPKPSMLARAFPPARAPASRVSTARVPTIPATVRRAATPQLRRALAPMRGFGSVTGGDVGYGEDGSGSDEPSGVQGYIDAHGGVPQSTPAPSGSGWPPTPGYRPGNWDFDASTYVLALGDTLSGLANLYLGSYQRWKEIWSLQPFRYTRSPDKLMAGEKLVMPHEARDRAKKMLLNTQAAPSTTGKRAPVPVEGEDPNAPVVNGGTTAVASEGVKKYLPWIAGGAAVLGIGYVALT
jgi:hypothetical protein